MAVTTQELRNAAADYIEAHGWCQNHPRDDDGRVCALGALRQIAFGGPLRMGQSHPHYLDFLHTRLDIEREIGKPIAEWNDAPERTQAEVIARLRGQAVNS